MSSPTHTLSPTPSPVVDMTEMPSSSTDSSLSGSIIAGIAVSAVIVVLLITAIIIVAIIIVYMRKARKQNQTDLTVAWR